jgi:hypothetical protein
LWYRGDVLPSLEKRFSSLQIKSIRSQALPYLGFAGFYIIFFVNYLHYRELGPAFYYLL